MMTGFALFHLRAEDYPENHSHCRLPSVFLSEQQYLKVF